MKKNIGSIDKVIRVLFAIVVAALYFTGVISGTLGIVLLIVGGVLLLTSIVGTCPIYLPFGISTGKKE
jgi:hypothetical protein